MKYTTLATTTAAGLVVAAGAHGQGSETAWTPATQTQSPPPVAGFTLRPTPALRMPRAGLLIREDDNDDDNDDDEDGLGSITHGSATPAGSSSGSVTSAPRPSNTCGWDQNGGGFYACSDSRASCQYTNGGVGCCSGNNYNKIPKQCVEQNKECDSDDNGGTLCCRHSSAPACYTWFISTSTAGRQEMYSMLGCTDKPGTGTLLPTDPASAGSSSSSSSGGGGGKSNTGAIVGGVIGGIIALLLVLLFLWYVLRQRRRGKAEHVVADRSLRDSAPSHASWAGGGAGAEGEHDGRGGGVEKMYEAVPKRKAVPGSETQDRSIGGYAATSPTTTTTTTTDWASPNEHSAYSVSSVSGTMGDQGGTGVVSSLSTTAAPPPLAGVVEAPDTGVPQQGSAAPVEVAGTTVTRETMQNRAELA